MKIYLDNCCFNRPFDIQDQIKIKIETEAKLYIQSEIKKGHIQLCWSYMMELENEDNPYEDKRNSIRTWKDRAELYCPASDGIKEMADKLMKHSIQPKDALHLACAITEKCDYFITTDIKLTNKDTAIDAIKIINPIDFVRRMEV